MPPPHSTCCTDLLARLHWCQAAAWTYPHELRTFHITLPTWEETTPRCRSSYATKLTQKGHLHSQRTRGRWPGQARPGAEGKTAKVAWSYSQEAEITHGGQTLSPSLTSRASAPAMARPFSPISHSLSLRGTSAFRQEIIYGVMILAGRISAANVFHKVPGQLLYSCFSRLMLSFLPISSLLFYSGSALPSLSSIFKTNKHKNDCVLGNGTDGSDQAQKQGN